MAINLNHKASGNLGQQEGIGSARFGRPRGMLVILGAKRSLLAGGRSIQMRWSYSIPNHTIALGLAGDEETPVF